jgi:hypothetical protein
MFNGGRRSLGVSIWRSFPGSKSGADHGAVEAVTHDYSVDLGQGSATTISWCWCPLPILAPAMEESMKRVSLVVLLMVFALNPALAEGTCKSSAIGKDGKPLAGAALNSYMTKCAKDTCEPKAIDKNGKPLAGAAKASFLKKCEADA